MNILITGISGFIGGHLADELTASYYKVFGINHTKKNENIFCCDLLSYEQISQVLIRKKFDWIIHLAALTSVNESWRDPVNFINTNSKMTQNLYKSIQKYSSLTKVILASSASIYGKQKKYPIKENFKPNPIDPYSKSKLEQEKISKKFTNIGTIIIRPFNQTGPGQSHLAISNFAKQIAICEKSEKDIIKIGNLDTLRDYVDIRDTSKAIKLLISKGKTNEAYNICSGKKIKMENILYQLINLSTKKIKILKDKKLIRPVDLPEFWGSHQKITATTGWEPLIPFNKTLLDTLNYWRNYI